MERDSKGRVPVKVRKLQGKVALISGNPKSSFTPFDSTYITIREGRINTIRDPMVSPLSSLTIHIVHTFSTCNPKEFRYLSSYNPRRVLTKPDKGIFNNNYDNENSELILYVNSVLGLQREKRNRYVVLDMLGQGTFGQVARCRHVDTGKLVAIKIIKNKPAYYKQGLIEVELLKMLNGNFDPDKTNLARLLDCFVDRDHLCIVFELLSSDLFGLLKQNHYRGLSTNLIRIFLRQLLISLEVLNTCSIIHCDLKPENILLRTPRSPLIKLIDFGSACFEGKTMYTYIQSRFYRSPEVLLGVPYDAKIDMWSLGCICAELFLGLPLFPGQSEFNQLQRIIEMLGDLPPRLLHRGKKTHKFFDEIEKGKKYRIKTQEQYEVEQDTKLAKPKKYFAFSSVSELVQNYPYKGGMKPEDIEREREVRKSFIDFIHGLLALDPAKRWTPKQAKGHPFVTGSPFNEPYKPKVMMKAERRKSLPVPSYPQSGAHFRVPHLLGGVPMYTTSSYGPIMGGVGMSSYTSTSGGRGRRSSIGGSYDARSLHGGNLSMHGHKQQSPTSGYKHSSRGPTTRNNTRGGSNSSYSSHGGERSPSRGRRPRSISHGSAQRGRVDQSKYLAGTATAEYGGAYRNTRGGGGGGGEERGRGGVPHSIHHTTRSNFVGKDPSNRTDTEEGHRHKSTAGTSYKTGVSHRRSKSIEVFGNNNNNKGEPYKEGRDSTQKIQNKGGRGGRGEREKKGGGAGAGGAGRSPKSMNNRNLIHVHRKKGRSSSTRRSPRGTHNNHGNNHLKLKTKSRSNTLGGKERGERSHSKPIKLSMSDPPAYNVRSSGGGGGGGGGGGRRRKGRVYTTTTGTSSKQNKTESSYSTSLVVSAPKGETSSKSRRSRSGSGGGGSSQKGSNTKKTTTLDNNTSRKHPRYRVMDEGRKDT